MQWGWYEDHSTCRLFIHLLLKANHSDSIHMGVTIKAGQHKTGRKILSRETGLSEQQIRTSLNKLKSTSDITITPKTKYSIITITNWDDYQSFYEPPTSKTTNNQPTINQQVTTNNNDNNDNKKNKGDYKPDYLEWYALYPKKTGKFEASKSYAKIIKSNTASHEGLIAGIKRYALHIKKQKTEDQYIKGPAVWLNGHHWEDETEVKKRKSGW